ncbi:MAG: hypothetical protein A2X64_05625 [Ignavibacteria bacterium GWF2_33_9]|nr:MAG: hypothetical protein A2X64_05625 [Ignavibacteria bacterium GWF2_33_9]
MKFFEKFQERLNSSMNDSDVAYFYDLLHQGEFLTKIVTLFLVSNLNNDRERTKYKYEYKLVRANAIGDFSNIIDEIITGPPSELLNSYITDYEFKELTYRSKFNDWQYLAQAKLIDCFTAFNLSVDKIGTKSPLRNWFNIFSNFRNKTRGHGAPKVENCSKAIILLNDSIQLIINNFSAFKRPWAFLHRNLSGKYRISYISSNKNTEFNYLKSETKHNLDNGIYCFVDNPRKIELFYSSPELIDFHITNGNLKANEFEALSYLTDDRILINASNYMTPIHQLPNSHTEGRKNVDVLGNSFSNLPLTNDIYVSRHQLENELTKILNEEDRFPIVTLVGRGGIGKTTLALNVIKEIANSKRFDIIVWFSSRDIDLLLEGPKQVQSNVLNQNDISKEFCSLYFNDEEIPNKIDFFSQEMISSSFGKALYVFDNFETLTNPIEIYEWINTYIRNPNKVLITSRINRNFKADYPIEIKGMTEIESKNLIDLFSKDLNIFDILTKDFIENLYLESDGHPYIIKILLGEVSKSNKLFNIERIVADQDKILIALFKRTFNLLSPAAKRVFLTLSSWNSIIPQIALEAVLWRSEEKIDISGAIEELRKSSFIDIIENEKEYYISLPLAASLFGKSELEVNSEKFKILDDKKLLMEFGIVSQTNLSSGLSSRIEKKFKSISKRTSNVEEFKKELPTLEYIASKYPKAYTFIVQIFEEFSDFENAKYFIREYLKHSLFPEEKAKFWFKLADICKLTNDWEGEGQALIELALIPQVEFYLISEAANRLNNCFYYHPEFKNVPYKKTLLDNIIGVMSKRINECNAIDYSRLGWLLLHNDNASEAKKMAAKGLELDQFNHNCQRLWLKLNS